MAKNKPTPKVEAKAEAKVAPKMIRMARGQAFVEVQPHEIEAFRVAGWEEA